MINNSSLQKWDRLKAKQLDSQFQNEIVHGMNCSPFEARAILDKVHDVYSDFFNNTGTPNPGQCRFVVTSIENGPSKKLSEAEMITVTLTIDAGEEDLNVKEQDGVILLRRHRLQRIAQEAFIQGGLLTIEDIADRIFNCGTRTLIRDIKAFKDKGIVLPLRSTIKDMGRALTHRTLIVQKWLDGKEYTDISRATNHSINAINNYVKKFRQVVALAIEGYDVHTISFLSQMSVQLATEYVHLWHHSDIIPARRDELGGLLKKKE